MEGNQWSAPSVPVGDASRPTTSSGHIGDDVLRFKKQSPWDKGSISVRFHKAPLYCIDENNLNYGQQHRALKGARGFLCEPCGDRILLVALRVRIQDKGGSLWLLQYDLRNETCVSETCISTAQDELAQSRGTSLLKWELVAISKDPEEQEDYTTKRKRQARGDPYNLSIEDGQGKERFSVFAYICEGNIIAASPAVVCFTPRAANRFLFDSEQLKRNQNAKKVRLNGSPVHDKADQVIEAARSQPSQSCRWPPELPSTSGQTRTPAQAVDPDERLAHATFVLRRKDEDCSRFPAWPASLVELRLEHHDITQQLNDLRDCRLFLKNVTECRLDIETLMANLTSTDNDTG